MSRMLQRWACALAAVALAVATHDQSAPPADPLFADDECHAADEAEAGGCALSELQRRGALRAAAAAASEGGQKDQGLASGSGVAEASWWSGSCRVYRCNERYRPGFLCQCNAKCGQYDNCCSDYYDFCRQPAPPPPAPAPLPPAGSGYGLSWAAQGRSFFDQWHFETRDVNHGAAEYLTKSAAEQAGVAEAHSSYAILRAGAASPRYQYKRQTAKIETQQSWKYFLVAMKFSHVPYGCGTWPAFFTLGQGAWPNAGEVDILEYVNMDVSKSSLHVGPGCTLNAEAVNKFGPMPDRNNMNYDCYTSYPGHLGCAPNKWMRTGQGWAQNPGVVAMEWTADFVKIFFIPRGEIPEDLDADAPTPDAWDRWLYSYYPFKDSGCSPDVMSAQKLIMQIGFCGDWASKVWHLDATCKPMAQSCRSVDPLAEYAPQDDCCTQFIYDEGHQHGTDSYLQDKAVFNISYVKVYQQR